MSTMNTMNTMGTGTTNGAAASILDARLSRRSLLALAAAAGLGLALGGNAFAEEAKQAAESEGATEGAATAVADHQATTYPVTITDRAGREVTIEKADRIATLCATGFDRMLVLGETKRIVGNFGSLTEWAKYCNGGDVESLGGGNVAGDPDVEALNALDIDVLYCWQEAIEAGNVTDPDQAAFQAVCAQLSTGNPTTVEEFRDYVTSEIYLYSDALASEEANARANAWVDYANEKFDYVISKTAGLSEDEIVPVYCARGGRGGDDPCNAFLKHSYPDFALQMAGGRNVADEAEGESYGDVTAEQIAVWNPQVVFCGRIADPAAITGSDVFAATDAVANGQVFLSPAGVMEWDTGSECVLNTLYIAKTLHPELFEDLDMVAEVQNYYATFFGTELTEQQAQNILDRKGPEE